MRVLSLFDGISGAKVALDRLGIVCYYYASEVDKHAMKVSRTNHPSITHLGDVRGVRGGDYDLIIGGSPCQGFSFAGKQLNFDDERSRLFFEYVRILNENKKCYFLLENVKMKKEYQDVISGLLGVEPIEINSQLVSAQCRKRLYWTNIPRVTQPKDKEIMLDDVVDYGIVDRNKSYCIDANYWKGGNLKSYFEKKRRQIVFCGAMRGRYLVNGVRQDGKMKTAGLTTQRMEVRYDLKTNTLTTVGKDNNLVFLDGYRKLSPEECERLQTFPDGYTSAISNTQRYKCLGNAFTVDVIKHILSFMEI